MKSKILQNINLYTKLRNDFTYHSSAIEGSTVTYEDNEKAVGDIELKNNRYGHDEWQENVNCGKLFDYVFETLDDPLTEKELKVWHNLLKRNTTWSKDYTSSYGDYKKIPNAVGSNYTSQPHEIPVLMKELFESYKNVNILTINEISKMHCQFEKIHPFLDGNGRIGRFIMLKQCLNNNVDLFYISNDTREEYINAIRMFISTGNSGFLTAYLKTCQKIFRITNAMYFDNDLNDNEIKILNYLNIHKEITVKIVEKILNLSLTPSNSLINKLIKKQYIKKFNQGKNTVYRVNK